MLVERLMPVSDSPDVSLFVAETEGGPDRTLLVVHGGPDWDQMYLRDPLVRLAGERRVVFVDLRGCGRSTRGLPALAHTPAASVADLVTLIGALGGGPVDVLGFSYGGLLTQRLLLAAPALVERAVFASCSVLPVPRDAFAGWAERDERQCHSGADRAHDGPWDDTRTRQAAIASAMVDLWCLELLPAYLRRLEGVRFSSDWSRAWPDRSKMPPARPDDSARQLRALGKPLLLLHGEQDMTFPAALVEPTTDLIPSAHGVVLPQAGHMAHVDQPERWLAAIRAFLPEGPWNELDRSGGSASTRIRGRRPGVVRSRLLRWRPSREDSEER